MIEKLSCHCQLVSESPNYKLTCTSCGRQLNKNWVEPVNVKQRLEVHNVNYIEPEIKNADDVMDERYKKAMEIWIETEKVQLKQLESEIPLLKREIELKESLATLKIEQINDAELSLENANKR